MTIHRWARVFKLVVEVREELSKSFGTSIDGRPINDIIEEAQLQVCVDNWDSLPNVKAKVMAMAKDLGIETMTPEDNKVVYIKGTAV